MCRCQMSASVTTKVRQCCKTRVQLYNFSFWYQVFSIEKMNSLSSYLFLEHMSDINWPSIHRSVSGFLHCVPLIHMSNFDYCKFAVYSDMKKCDVPSHAFVFCSSAILDIFMVDVISNIEIFIEIMLILWVTLYTVDVLTTVSTCIGECRMSFHLTFSNTL